MNKETHLIRNSDGHLLFDAEYTQDGSEWLILIKRKNNWTQVRLSADGNISIEEAKRTA